MARVAQPRLARTWEQKSRKRPPAFPGLFFLGLFLGLFLGGFSWPPPRDAGEAHRAFARAAMAGKRLVEALQFLGSAVPIASVDFIKLLVPAMTTMHVGHTSTEVLAAAALGTLSFNIAGNMIATAPLSVSTMLKLEPWTV